MSEVFDGYERQYCEISASPSRMCMSDAQFDGGSIQYFISLLCFLCYFNSESIYGVFNPIIRKMDLEARSLQPSIKAGLSTKLREYKSDINNLKSELKRIFNPNPNQAAREELLEFKGREKLNWELTSNNDQLMSMDRESPEARAPSEFRSRGTRLVLRQSSPPNLSTPGGSQVQIHEAKAKEKHYRESGGQISPMDDLAEVAAEAGAAKNKMILLDPQRACFSTFLKEE
ncbi:hypothetical protein ZIOFF_012925 [Zingiber officinale]|uniref:Vesicle transport v-SNARE N-terminal domain-containing protein n=1 Tax=Zingiber officinale TaxID=94328 RepID=A0A8J5HYY8_ZINOF|nr:hypothetical protein ZIOFF_012925 [Zingiber officinale]